MTFDASAYAAKYTDLAAAFGDDAEALARHYVLYGYAEGRTSAPLSTSTPVSISAAAPSRRRITMHRRQPRPLPLPRSRRWPMTRCHRPSS
ncbi:hypothetical protein P0F65_06600 [Sphingomonas sp. I4]